MKSDFDITRVADLARIDLTEAEKQEFSGQLDQVLVYIEQLKAIDVEGIEPTAHAEDVFDVYREDEEQPDHLLSQDAVLQNAPATAHEQIKMPKVIE